MLHANTISFLTELAQNNNKIWFDANRDKYTAAKEDFENQVGELLAEIAQKDPAFSEQKAKDCVFRIFRDVRFGKDKTPYKPNFGAFFSKGGKKYPGAGFYLHIEPGGKCFAGGGLWMPETPILKAIRQEVDYNFEEFKSIIDEKKFKKTFAEISGERVKTLPAGYTADNPAIEYLKLKSFTVMHHIDDDTLKSKNLTKSINDIFKTMQPFIDFLNRAIVTN